MRIYFVTGVSVLLFASITGSKFLVSLYALELGQNAFGIGILFAGNVYWLFRAIELVPVPVAILTELVSGDVYQWGALMAGSLLGSLPVAIFYSFFVDYYVSSLTGAVKE